MREAADHDVLAELGDGLLEHLLDRLVLVLEPLLAHEGHLLELLVLFLCCIVFTVVCVSVCLFGCLLFCMFCLTFVRAHLLELLLQAAHDDLLRDLLGLALQVVLDYICIILYQYMIA